MNARNKLKTTHLMGIDTHIVYYGHRINHGKIGDRVSLKTEHSWGSCHSDSASRVGMGSF